MKRLGRAPVAAYTVAKDVEELRPSGSQNILESRTKWLEDSCQRPGVSFQQDQPVSLLVSPYF